MEWKKRKFDPIYSVTPELAIISLQKYTQNPELGMVHYGLCSID